MTSERINELERLAASSIKECQLLGCRADNASLAFWRGVKTVVDELKMGIVMPEPECAAEDSRSEG